MSVPPGKKPGRVRMWGFYSTVFLGAFLLFQVEPMMCKALLPSFGGSYLVWGACMAFFQSALLVGYLLAHFGQTRLGVRAYAWVHGAMLLAPLAFCPFQFGHFGEMADHYPLVAAVALALLGTVGLPFVTLSTTSLVLQRWLSISSLPQRPNPYVLYATSNLGSLLALLSYPVLVEPFFSLQVQGRAWWIGYLVLILLHLSCLPKRSAGSGQEGLTERGTAVRLPAAGVLRWLLLSAAACSALLASTNVLTFDVASVPFLWVLPLSVYLLCFVLSFKARIWYPTRIREMLPWAVALGVVLDVMTSLHLDVPVLLGILLHLGILFVICLNCTGHLALLKPADTRLLTGYYLVTVTGGLLGSLLVTWIIPLLSQRVVEYPLSLLLATAAVAVAAKDPGREDAGQWLPLGRTVIWAVIAFFSLTLLPWFLHRELGSLPNTRGLAMAAMGLPVLFSLRAVANRPAASVAILAAILVAMTWTEELAAGASHVHRCRNFYGIYRIYDSGGLRYLQHGTTLHSREWIDGPKRGVPQSYYHPTTPMGHLLTAPGVSFTDVGMIGLGTGALAAYARPEQKWTIFELDPDCLPIAERNFTFLADARGRGVPLTFVFGDGRLSVRQLPDASLDLLIIDAFNSGSVPVHLLTIEAISEYFRALRPDGLLLLHISNRVLSLEPVVSSNGRSLGLNVAENYLVNAVPDADATQWMALTYSESRFNFLLDSLGWKPRSGVGPRKLPPPWTDQYCNLLRSVSW